VGEGWVKQKLSTHTAGLPNESNILQVSNSPIFYKQLFQMKVFCAVFMCLQFGFVFFGGKDAHLLYIYLFFFKKARHYILMFVAGYYAPAACW
jgi:hypothetical protein